MQTFARLLILTAGLLALTPSAGAREMNIIEQFESHVAQREWARALPIIEEIVQRKPDFATSWRNYGVVLDELGRHAEAAKAFRRSYELKPDDHRTQYRAFRSLALANDVSGFVEFAAQEAQANPEIVAMIADGEEFSAIAESPEFKALAEKYR